jgi:coenzyme F420-reducing hydrogenase gamma subunit
MRKLLYVLAFIVAGPAAFCAFSSEASAQISCTLTKSETTFQSDRESCKKTCTEALQKDKKPQDIPGCHAGCDNVFKTCVQRKKDSEENDKKKKVDEEKKRSDEEKKKDAEAKQKDFDHKKYLCRKPYTDCLEKCPKGNKACEETCNKSPAFTNYETCIKKLVP